MVGGGDDNHVAGELVQLHQEERYHALDLACLMGVASFLADCVKLIEEQYTRLGPHVVKKLSQARIGFAKITADQSIIADNEKRECQRLGDCLSVGSLAIAGRARQQNAVTRFISMGAQNVGASMFLNELPAIFSHRQRQDQILQPGSGFNLNDRVAPGTSSIGR